MKWMTSVEMLTPDALIGFFDGWPHPPTPEQHLALLRRSTYVVLACTDHGEVVGFITALSDGVLTAYIPLLEVRREHQGHGIGTTLVMRLLDQLPPLYMIDIVCDPSVQPFYEQLGFQKWSAAIRRNPAAIELRSHE